LDLRNKLYVLFREGIEGYCGGHFAEVIILGPNSWQARIGLSNPTLNMPN